MKGWNEEIPYKGTRFHLQTQDLGSPESAVQALLYKAGRLVLSRKISYAAYLNQPNFAEKVETIFKDLHKTILAEIHSGRFDHLLTPEEKRGSGSDR